MIELRVLGALDLRPTGGPEILSVLSQPKRTALLCYLALATPRGFHRKDRLVGIFWPEHDQEHARAALRQAVYFLRRSLGEAALLSRGDDELSASSDLLWCDAAAFEQAIADGQPEAALELYRGDLLQGFFVEDAPEFERWVTGERERLRGRAAEAAWAAAEKAERAGDAGAASELGKRALALSPADETVARRLMTLLERLGDGAAAIRAYEAFAWKLEQELGLEPSVETRALAEAIRERAGAREAADAQSTPPSASPRRAAAGPSAPAPPAGASAPVAAGGGAATAFAAEMPGADPGAWTPPIRPASPIAPRATRPPAPKPGLLARVARLLRLVGPPPDRSVAVLPFANFSPSPGDDYLGDAISDEIIGTLAKIHGLRVAARTSSFVFRGGDVDVREIGRRLNVGAILEGSIQRAGNVLRVTTQLIDARDGFHLWSAHWDGRMDDVFRIEDEIAANVGRVLATLLGAEERRPVLGALGARGVARAKVPAYESYLRGREYFFQTRRRSLRYAREMFGRAIEADPSYALAWAALADTIALERMYYAGAEVDMPKAEEASLKALQLAPELGEAHSARGNVLFMAGRLAEAEAEYREAVRRDASLWEPRYFFARMCFQSGRTEEAARLFQDACSVREDYQATFFAAQALEALGREEEAATWYDRANTAADNHLQLHPDDARACTTRAVALCRLGRKEDGLAWGVRALAADPDDAGVRYNVACLHAVAGEPDAAIALLEEALPMGFGNREWLERDPDLDSLRGDPRFQALLALQ